MAWFSELMTSGESQLEASSECKAFGTSSFAKESDHPFYSQTPELSRSRDFLGDGGDRAAPRAELDELRAAIGTLSAGIAGLQAQTCALRAANGELREEIRALRTDNDELRQQIRASRAERHADSARGTGEPLQGHLCALQREVALQRDVTLEVGGEILVLRREAAGLRGEIETLKKRSLWQEALCLGQKVALDDALPRLRSLREDVDSCARRGREAEESFKRGCADLRRDALRQRQTFLLQEQLAVVADLVQLYAAYFVEPSLAAAYGRPLAWDEYLSETRLAFAAHADGTLGGDELRASARIAAIEGPAPAVRLTRLRELQLHRMGTLPSCALGAKSAQKLFIALAESVLRVLQGPLQPFAADITAMLQALAAVAASGGLRAR